MSMNELNKQYQESKRKANIYMQNGQIASYFTALLEMNKYKKLMLAVVAN
jgi:hypothetical protein